MARLDRAIGLDTRKRPMERQAEAMTKAFGNSTWSKTALTSPRRM